MLLHITCVHNAGDVRCDLEIESWSNLEKRGEERFMGEYSMVDLAYVHLL